jgi:predicted amidohydrolase
MEAIMRKAWLLLLPSLGPTALGASQEGVSAKAEVSVAAVQIAGYAKVGAAEEGLDPVAVLVPYIEQAGLDGVDLLVFPEYHLGRIHIPGPETERIGETVRRRGLYVIVGAWELLDDGAFANTALLFGRDGDVVGKYRKTHAAVDGFDENKPPWLAPPAGRDRQWFVENDPEWVMQRGDSLPVFTLDFGRIGVLTCYDGWFPEPWRVLSLQGAEIVVWINGRGGSVEDYIVRSAMFQNEIHVVTGNQAYGAGTMIGQYPDVILEHVSGPGEASIRATLDLERLRQVRAHSRNFAQRRPELYGAITNPAVSRGQYVCGDTEGIN